MSPCFGINGTFRPMDGGSSLIIIPSKVAARNNLSILCHSVVRIQDMGRGALHGSGSLVLKKKDDWASNASMLFQKDTLG